MKIFNVYRHPVHGVEAVKVGFSWPAFSFGLIWMLVKKLWGWAGLFFAVNLACAFVQATADASSDDGSKSVVYILLFCAYMALWLVPAFKGNKWRESNLQSRGFRLTGTEVQGETPDAAIATVAATA